MISESDAREAIRLCRNAVNRIRSIQATALPRWSDGLPAWLSDERSEVEQAAEIAFDERELGIYRAAREELFDALRRNPFLPDAYVLLGNAAADIEGDFTAMLEYYGRAIELDPDNDDYYNGRMAHHLNTGQLESAAQDLLHLERLDSPFAESMRGHYESAVRESATSIPPTTDSAGDG